MLSKELLPVIPDLENKTALDLVEDLKTSLYKIMLDSAQPVDMSQKMGVQVSNAIKKKTDGDIIINQIQTNVNNINLIESLQVVDQIQKLMFLEKQQSATPSIEDAVTLLIESGVNWSDIENAFSKKATLQLKSPDAVTSFKSYQK